LIILVQMISVSIFKQSFPVNSLPNTGLHIINRFNLQRFMQRTIELLRSILNSPLGKCSQRHVPVFNDRGCQAADYQYFSFVRAVIRLLKIKIKAGVNLVLIPFSHNGVSTELSSRNHLKKDILPLLTWMLLRKLYGIGPGKYESFLQKCLLD
jgi:hypothetical protein